LTGIKYLNTAAATEDFQLVCKKRPVSFWKQQRKITPGCAGAGTGAGQKEGRRISLATFVISWWPTVDNLRNFLLTPMAEIQLFQ
jgi:hypothetical protein